MTIDAAVLTRLESGPRRLTLAFESARLSYSHAPVDLHNPTVNRILALGVERGHHLWHFAMTDLFANGGVPMARMTPLVMNPSIQVPSVLSSYRLVPLPPVIMPLDQLDAIIVRGDDIRNELELPQIRLLQQMEGKIRVVESVQATLETCDKFQLLLRLPDVPQPQTFAATTLDEAFQGLDQLHRDSGMFVLKDRFGYGCGATVHRIDANSPNLAATVQRYLEQYTSILIQEYCPEVVDGDLRVTFLDGKLLGAIRRQASEGEWRTNLSLGGHPEPWALTRNQEAIAQRVATAFPECRTLGVDLLLSGKVLEVNAMPGSAGLLACHGIDLGQMLLDLLEAEVSPRSIGA